MLFLIALLTLNFNCLVIYKNILLDKDNELATHLPAMNYGGRVFITDNNTTSNYTYTLNPLTSSTTICDYFKNNISDKEHVCYDPLDANNCGLSKEDFISRIISTLLSNYESIDAIVKIKNYTPYILFLLYTFVFFSAKYILSKGTKFFILTIAITTLLMLIDRILLGVILSKYMLYIQEEQNLNPTPDFLSQNRHQTMILNVVYLVIDIIIHLSIFLYTIYMHIKD